MLHTKETNRKSLFFFLINDIFFFSFHRPCQKWQRKIHTKCKYVKRQFTLPIRCKGAHWRWYVVLFRRIQTENPWIKKISIDFFYFDITVYGCRKITLNIRIQISIKLLPERERKWNVTLRVVFVVHRQLRE